MRIALVRSVAAALIFVVVLVFAVHSTLGQRLDEATLGALTWSPAGELLGELRTTGLMLTLVAFGLVVITRLIGGPRAATVLPAAAVIVVYAVCVVLRDAVIVRPDWGLSAYDANTLPSAHAAVAAICVAGVARLVPDNRLGRISVVFAAGCAFVASVGSVASHAHRMSDVLAGLLLAVVVVPWLSLSSRCRPRPTPHWILWSLTIWAPIAGLAVVTAGSPTWPLVSSAALVWTCGSLIALITCWARMPSPRPAPRPRDTSTPEA